MIDPNCLARVGEGLTSHHPGTVPRTCCLLHAQRLGMTSHYSVFEDMFVGY